MKKLFVLLIVFTFAMCLFGCGRFGYAGGPYYFTGKIISENEKIDSSNASVDLCAGFVRL